MGSWSHDCSSSAGLLDSYPALVLYLAGVALHQQPMGSRSHDCSSYVGCGGIPCSILVSPNASLHKWQQAVAPGWLPYMVPQNWIQALFQKWPQWVLDMFQGPLCPNLTQKVQKKVSQMVNHDLPIAKINLDLIKIIQFCLKIYDLWRNPYL